MARCSYQRWYKLHCNGVDHIFHRIKCFRIISFTTGWAWNNSQASGICENFYFDSQLKIYFDIKSLIQFVYKWINVINFISPLKIASSWFSIIPRKLKLLLNTFQKVHIEVEKCSKPLQCTLSERIL